MPSFDIVSKVDNQEVRNAVDQANREIGTRFDFKGTNSKVEYTDKDHKITLIAPSDFQVKQLNEIMQNKLIKRGIDVRSLKYEDPTVNLSEARQSISVKQGIETESAKKIVKLIKDKQLKVQTAIQGDQLRVTGKKRDDLQEVIAMLRTADTDLPLQFENFRD